MGPGYQVPLARAVKAATNLPTITVGLITDFDQAEQIVGTGDADFIAIARTILYDPRWPWHAAAHLGATERCQTISALPTEPIPQVVRCLICEIAFFAFTDLLQKSVFVSKFKSLRFEPIAVRLVKLPPVC